jgi:HPt (histidine-containing phosphotransfer) domain-containing protein
MPSETTQHLLDQLRDKYVATFPRKVADLRAVWDPQEPEGPDLEGLAQLRQQAHKLAGSGASYGFATISDAAASLEAEITGILERPDTLDWHRLSGAVGNLIDNLESPPEA